MSHHAGLTVPLITPTPSQLRAGALWVEIANWSDAFVRRYGGAEIITPSGSMTPTEAREVAWSEATAVVTSPTARPSHLRTFAKDLRSARRAAEFSLSSRKRRAPDAPFVWQHHMMFQRAGLDLARRSGVPLVLFVDAPLVWEAASWGVSRPGWGRLAERLGETPQFRRADAICCVSEEVATAVVERGGRADRVLVTPCSADQQAYRSAVPRRDELGLADRTVVGWVGSFRPFHRVEQLVRAAAAADPRSSSISLLMVGDGPTRADNEHLAAELGVHAVFTGSVSNTEVPSYVASMDAGVILAGPDDRFHYSPLKLKEYLAAGIATVVPRIGEMGREMSHGVDTLMFEPGHDAELAERLAEVVADPALRRAVATAGAELFDRRFTVERQLDAIEEVLGLEPPPTTNSSATLRPTDPEEHR